MASKAEQQGQGVLFRLYCGQLGKSHEHLMTWINANFTKCTEAQSFRGMYDTLVSSNPTLKRSRPLSVCISPAFEDLSPLLSSLRFVVD